MLKGKNIVIIGGTTGIGSSAAKYFSHEGAHVLAMGLSAGDIAETSDCKIFEGDARIEKHVEEALDFGLKTFGSIDGLYHVAGGSGRKWGDGPLHDLSTEAWNRTIEWNLTTVMISNRAFIRRLHEEQKSGAIVNLSSALVESPSPRYFYTHSYITAKAGIIGFSRSIASYYASQNIRVNVISPGLIRTPMSQRAQGNEEIQHFINHKQPLDGGRMGEPTDLDAAAAYFLSDHSKFTTGQELVVDGGWSISEGQYPSQ